jgi:hypothetical protein
MHGTRRDWVRWYPFVAPILLAPAALYLWWQSSHSPLVTAVAWGVPIAWAYIVPGVGTNVNKVWEFDTRLKLGRFRLHHGFVFGSATAMLVWLIRPLNGADGAPGAGWIWPVVQFAFIEACVLGAINYLYDVKVLRLGILRVYNEPSARGQPPEVVALDYAPWIFGGFGAAHGACLGGAMALAARQPQEWGGAAAVALYAGLSLLACIAVPIAGFMAQSWRRHGHAGLRPVHPSSGLDE